MVMAAPRSRRNRHGGRWVSTQTPQNTHSLGENIPIHPIPRTPGDLPPKIINIDIYYVHFIYIYGTPPEDLRFKQIYILYSIIIMIIAFF
jgi:hypothetical protein